MKTKIKDVLKEKGSKVISISPYSTVYDAISLMAANKIGAVMVMNKEKIEGIFTERDYLIKVILQGYSSKNTLVKNTMTVQLARVEPENTVEEGMSIMTEKRCRHLPVLENNKLVGMVSIGDLVKQVIKDQKTTISQLEDYIKINY
jgi:CBS domain-containing protein